MYRKSKIQKNIQLHILHHYIIKHLMRMCKRKQSAIQDRCFWNPSQEEAESKNRFCTKSVEYGPTFPKYSTKSKQFLNKPKGRRQLIHNQYLLKLLSCYDDGIYGCQIFQALTALIFIKYGYVNKISESFRGFKTYRIGSSAYGYCCVLFMFWQSAINKKFIIS